MARAGKKRRRKLSRRKRLWISRKIRFLIVHEGRSQAQAAAIAYRMVGVKKRKKSYAKRKRRYH